jgi:hypothetical protein
MHRRRWPVALSATVLLGQLLHRSPLTDVASGAIPADLALRYPLPHVLLAPLTLPADWLNGGSRHDLYGWLAWALVVAVLGSIIGWNTARRHTSSWRRMALRVLPGTAVLTAAVALVAWTAWGERPVPMLRAPAGWIVFDVHTHTERSHDGRAGFDAAANAAWHRRTGFHAAFITDHNTNGAAGDPGAPPSPGAVRLLAGTELSLNGLHLLILGTADSVDNRPWSSSWDSSLALVRHLSARSDSSGALDPPGPPLLVASLPEFWRYRWGHQIGQLIEAGAGGFEVWTSSPRAMEFPPRARATLVAQAAVRTLALAGATDMHGLGRSASVWNVAPLEGWEALSRPQLAAALVGLMREGRTRVIAAERWLPASRLDHVIALPVNLALILRCASRAHGAALIGWIWLVALLVSPRRPGLAP